MVGRLSPGSGKLHASVGKEGRLAQHRVWWASSAPLRQVSMTRGMSIALHELTGNITAGHGGNG